MSRRLSVSRCGFALLACFASTIAPRAWTQAPDDLAQAQRDAYIAREIERLQLELDRYGGWAKWREALEPVRADVIDLVNAARAEESNLVRGAGAQYYRWEPLLHWCENIEKIAGSDGAILRQWPSIDVLIDISSQLRQRGIFLVVVPIPAKNEIYPEAFSAHTSENAPSTLVRHAFLMTLLNAGIEAIDLYPALHSAKIESDELLYIPQDSHWSARAVQIAAGVVADNLKRYPFLKNYERVRYRTIPMVYSYEPPFAERHLPPAQRSELPRIEDPGKQVRDMDDRPYRYTEFDDSPVLLLGDSFMMGARPGGSFAAHVANELSMPVSGSYQRGGAMTGARSLARKGGEYIAKRKIIVWYMVATKISYNNWVTVKLP